MKTTNIVPTIYFVIVLLFSVTSNCFSQEINANVVVNKDRLSQENIMNISSLERDLTNYVNNQKFTNIDWEGPAIPVEINIVLAGGTGGNYSAQLFIISKRYLNGDQENASIGLKLLEQKWSFNYAQGGYLTFNPQRFDNFTSMIDYYMLLIIGYDMDTYEELAGSASYDLAKQICLLGASNNVDGYQTFTQPGEFTKYNLINELTDLKSENLRKLFFSFYADGLDVLAENREQGKKNIEQVISEMADYKKNVLTGPSVAFQAFFDSKAQEIADIFKGYSSKQVFEDLMYLDPGNSTIYREAKGN